MRKPFLTAVWSNLCLVTYAVPAELLEPRLADGLVLDTIDGSAFVSLVAFDFLDTRVFETKWPGMVNFPEINLRFYVRQPATGRRGVMFVKELVPSRLIARVARTLYNEPYQATAMSSSVQNDGAAITVSHRWKWRGTNHALTVTSDARARLPDADSDAHFFKEHQWGFGKSRKGAALEYEVRHPLWEIYDVESHQVKVDFGTLYGAEFAALDDRPPHSVVHAVGSRIEVYPPRLI